MDTALVQRVRRSPALRPPAIAAYRTLDRLRPSPPGPRIVCNSMPKSGTHLLATLLDQLPGVRPAAHLLAYDAADAVRPQQRLAQIDRILHRLRRSHYVGAHLMHDQRIEHLVTGHDVSMVTILRDPRAIVLSGAHYVATATQLKGRAKALELFPDHDSILRALVLGHGEPGDEFYFPEIGERFRRYAGWRGAHVGLVIRFEDLVGDQGGGVAEQQHQTVARVVDHLGYPTDEVRPAEIAQRLFSPEAITFRTGRVDSWRDELPADLADEIASRCAADMERLGYQD